MIKNQKMRLMMIESDMNTLCWPHKCFNQAMVLTLIEILNQQWKGPLAKKRKQKMKDACIFIKQSEIEDFAKRVFSGLKTLYCQNSENQLNDLDTFTELIFWLYHREFDKAIETFNQLTSTNKRQGWDSGWFYLEKISQYCDNPETVKMFQKQLSVYDENVY